MREGLKDPSQWLVDEDDPSGSLMDTRECYGPSLQLKELGWKKVGRTRTLTALQHKTKVEKFWLVGG